MELLNHLPRPLPHTHPPGAKHRKKGASDGRRAHRFASSSRSGMHHPASAVAGEVDVMRRAIWATSRLDASQSQRRPSCTSLARRSPKIRFWTSSRRHQRGELCAERWNASTRSARPSPWLGCTSDWGAMIRRTTRSPTRQRALTHDLGEVPGGSRTISPPE